ncbi:hypothetical protein SBC1_79000 (plasmid) [Caballeronia sp. SBC1]|uniref:DUF6817 domain-containing protein n=1 Tax=Caballeronia sp. SBC1 TaxID=2705548 RepID=UPI00140E26F1|nr:hypothetical protein [Caballeronia sp. SBC1]QIN67853.1 hypothetical protein SBC1_79000 [Caballeronia sp. SBC1]
MSTTVEILSSSVTSIAPILAFLRARGAAKIDHSGTKLLNHLLGTYDILDHAGAPEHVALAGLIHSVFGTSAFEHTVCRWDEAPLVAELAGEQAARLSLLFCRLDRRVSTINGLISGRRSDPIDRITRDALPLSPDEVVALAWLEAANLLEQNALASAPALARGARAWGMVGPHGFRVFAMRTEDELLASDRPG